MTVYRDVQRTFTKGEQDPQLAARDDVVAYHNGAKRLRNVWVLPQGGIKRRPGLPYKATLCNVLSEVDLSSATITTPNGGTGASLRDDDLSTILLTTTNVGTTNGYVAFQFDMGSDTAADFADVNELRYAGAPTAVSNDEWQLEGKVDGGGSFEAIGDPAVQVDDDAMHLRVAPTKAYRYYRLIRNGTSNAGTNGVRMTEFRLWTQTSTTSAVEIFPYKFSDDQRYLLVLTDRCCEVFKLGVLQTRLWIPHTTAQLPEATVAVKEDTLLIMHPDVQMHQLKRLGFDDRWYSAPLLVFNVPTHDFGAGAEASMSDTRGWPRCGLFYAGRLLLAGLKGRPSTMLGSRAGAVYDFDTSSTNDDYGFNVSVDPSDGKTTPQFNQIFEGAHLQLFASDGEYYIPVSEDTPLTPTNVTLRRTSSRGSKIGLRVFDVDGATHFVQKEGRALREFIYTDLSQKYEANNLSLLSTHLMRDPVAIDVLRSTSAEDADFVITANDDGTGSVFTTLRAQEVQAWSLGIVTDGSLVAIGVDGIAPYVAVERDIGGTTYNFLEQLDWDYYTDSSVRADVVSTTAAASGLDHLEGETVDVVVDGAVQTQKTVSSGAVTFDTAAEESWECGLPWPSVQANYNASSYDTGETVTDEGLTCWGETLPDVIEGPRGVTRGQRRRIIDAYVQVHRSEALSVEGYDMTFPSGGEYTGALRIGALRGWARDRTLSFGSDTPLPLTVLGLAYKLDVED